MTDRLARQPIEREVIKVTDRRDPSGEDRGPVANPDVRMRRGS